MTDETRTADVPRDVAEDLRRRVHTNLPRVDPADMVTTQEASAPQDPTRGHDVDREFVIRHAPGL